jgi:hypothetical protein
MSLFPLPVLLSLMALLPQAPAINPAAAADSPLAAYESCHFQDGLQVVQVEALPPGVQQRSVDTERGPKTIKMLAGRRVMLGYATGSFVANLKPEVLPADLWGVEKQTMLDELGYLLASDHANVPASGLPEHLAGLELHGFDHSSLTGKVLGFYMLFDDARHIATSVYLLNQDPLTRSFQTVPQYRDLRTRLLTGYADCIAQNQALRGAGAKP